MVNRRVRVMWCDLNGLSHGRYVPDRRFGHHGHHAVTTLTMGLDRDILPVEGYAADVGFPDLTSVPVLESRRNGWEVDTDVAVASLEYGHQPLAICPRAALVRAVEVWRALGYEPMLGFELEFYVLQPAGDAPGGWATLDNPSHRVYGLGSGGDTTGLMFDLFDRAEEMGLDVEGIMGEFHPGQMELNLHYAPAVESADRVFIAKDMTREVAAAKGYKLTYLGRPNAMLVGSGLHINASLVPTGSDYTAPGQNVLFDPAAEHGLSSIARQCIGGLIDHHEALAAVSAPLINSYKRLQPGLLAGYWANWGLDNRISTYRIPGERGAATRIENRMPCSSANPYLAAAAMLNAMLLGVADGSECGTPQLGDGDAEPNTDRHTPHTLAEALDALEADGPMCEALGPDLVRAFTAIRRAEIGRWETAGETWDPETISEWELNEYLPFY